MYDPKTVEEYIAYAAFWLSGDAGWSEQAIEEFMLDFKKIVEEELLETQSIMEVE